MFDNFGDMLWGAIMFNCMWEVFESGCFNIFCLVLGLEWEKTNLRGQKTFFDFVKIIIFLENCWEMKFLQYLCGAVILNLVFLLWTRLDKLHKIWIALSKGSLYVGDVELFYVADKFQVSFNYMKILKFCDKRQIPVYDSSHRFVLDLCLYIEDETNLKLIR